MFLASTHRPSQFWSSLNRTSSAPKKFRAISTIAVTPASSSSSPFTKFALIRTDTPAYEKSVLRAASHRTKHGTPFCCRPCTVGIAGICNLHIETIPVATGAGICRMTSFCDHIIYLQKVIFSPNWSMFYPMPTKQKQFRSQQKSIHIGIHRALLQTSNDKIKGKNVRRILLYLTAPTPYREGFPAVHFVIVVRH